MWVGLKACTHRGGAERERETATERESNFRYYVHQCDTIIRGTNKRQNKNADSRECFTTHHCFHDFNFGKPSLPNREMLIWRIWLRFSTTSQSPNYHLFASQRRSCNTVILYIDQKCRKHWDSATKRKKPTKNIDQSTYLILEYSRPVWMHCCSARFTWNNVWI